MDWEFWVWVVGSVVALCLLARWCYRYYCFYSDYMFRFYFEQIEESFILINDNLWRMKSAAVTIDGDDSTEKIAVVVDHLEQLLGQLDNCETLQDNFDIPWYAIVRRFTRGQGAIDVTQNLAVLKRTYQMCLQDPGTMELA